MRFNCLFLIVLPSFVTAQQVIKLPYDKSEEDPSVEERTFTNGFSQTQISGVTEPSVTVYLPAKDKATGSAVILCPGGGMRVLSWSSDVEAMARYLNERGIAAIGLKYRLVNKAITPDEPMAPTVDVTGFDRFRKANANPVVSKEGDRQNMRGVRDCRQAVRTVREHASEWGIDKDKIGLIGFSAGGGVAVGATVTAEKDEMPDFLVSVFGPSLMDVNVPENAPDLLVLTRADHANVAAGCLQLFLEWKRAGKNAELHMYGDGNGPFGLSEKKWDNTTEMWTDNLMSWLMARGFASRPVTH